MDRSRLNKILGNILLVMLMCGFTFIVADQAAKQIRFHESVYQETGSTEVLEIKDGTGSENLEINDLGQNPLMLNNGTSDLKMPILVYDNGVMNLIVKDADIPKGPCDFGDLVRAARSYLYPGTSKTAGEALDLAAINRMKLVTELDKCEPSK